MALGTHKRRYQPPNNASGAKQFDAKRRDGKGPHRPVLLNDQDREWWPRLAEQIHADGGIANVIGQRLTVDPGPTRFSESSPPRPGHR